MTPYDSSIIEKQDAIAYSLYRDGECDANAGISPSSKDSAYLDGYFRQLRERVMNGRDTLIIRWLSPSFTAGGYDALDYNDCPF